MALSNVPPDDANTGDPGHVEDHNLIRAGLIELDAEKADDTAVVHKTGSETIAGIKTFSSSPIVPTPTTSTQAANKSYVDSVVVGGSPAPEGLNVGVVNVDDYGAVCDARSAFGGVTTSAGVTTVQTDFAGTTWGVAPPSFLPSDVGKVIHIDNVGTTVAPNGNNGGTRGWWRTTISQYIDYRTVRVAGTPTYQNTGGYHNYTWGTDNTTAINNAIDAMPEVGGVLFFPGRKLAESVTSGEGSYLTGGGHVLPPGTPTVLGRNKMSSVVTSYGLDNSCFTLPVGGYTLYVKDIFINHTAASQINKNFIFETHDFAAEWRPTAPTSGAAFNVPDGGWISRFENAYIVGFYKGIYLNNSNLSSISNCQIVNFVHTGVEMDSTLMDWGGCLIENTAIGNSHNQYMSDGKYCVNWRSGGAFHMTEGQTNGAAYGVYCNMNQGFGGDASYGTSQIHIIGVGFEDHGDRYGRWGVAPADQSHVFFGSDTVGDLVSCIIANNHFAQALGSGRRAIHLGGGTGGLGPRNPANGRVGHFSITGNTTFGPIDELAYIETGGDIVFAGNAGPARDKITIGSSANIAQIDTGYRHTITHTWNTATLSTGLAPYRWYNNTGRAVTVKAMHLTAGTAPLTQSIIVDVNLGTSSIFSSQGHRPSISPGGFNSGRLTTNVQNLVIPAGQYVQFEIDQVGTSNTGGYLTANIEVYG